MKQSKAIRIGRERVAAFVTLVLATALVTYAATASTAFQIPTTKTPVNGNARVADEPPLRSAIGKKRVVRMEVTAYCPCIICCGPKACGMTAWGKPVTFNHGHFVAADTAQLPFGTKVVVPGYNDGKPVPVADRGGAIRGDRLDLFFPTHEQALKWGRRWVMVTVLEK